MTNWTFYTVEDLKAKHPEILDAIKAEAVRHNLPFDRLMNDSMYQTNPESPLYISMAHLDEMIELILTYDFKKKRMVDSVTGPYNGDE